MIVIFGCIDVKNMTNMQKKNPQCLSVGIADKSYYHGGHQEFVS